MTIFETLFGARPQNPVPQGQGPQNSVDPQQQQQPPQNAPQTAPQSALNNPQVPSQNTVPPGNSGEGSPVDKFKDLFTIDPNQSQSNAPLFNLEPEKFNKVVQSQNFANNIGTDDIKQLTTALGGNEEATKAVLRMMNTMVQNGFGTSVQASAKLTESGAQHLRTTLSQELPSQMKRQAAQDEIFTKYPQLQDEAVKPLVGTVQQLVQNKHPNATTSEVNDLVVQYFNEKIPGAFGRTSSVAETPKETTPAQGNFASWLN